MVREVDADTQWCPMGRISIQQGTSQARVEAVQTGAFNRVLTHAPGYQTQGVWAYPSRCMGEGCAWWRWGFFSGLGLVPAKYRRGCCGKVSPPPYGDVAASIALLGLAALLVFVKL